MSDLVCCGCHLASDYGTQVTTGEGSSASPFTVTQVDPEFKRPLVRVGLTLGTNQSFTTGVDGAVSFTVEYFDSDNMWVVGSPTRLTIPKAGIYLIGFTGKWTSSVNAQRELWIRLNGTTELDRKSAQNGNAVNHPFTMNYVYYFNVGDYIEFMGLQSSGGALTMLSDSSNPITAWMMYMGRKI